MPSLATLRAAVPKCRKGACTRILTWDHMNERWRCPDHGFVLSGQMAALAATTFDQQRIIEENRAA